MKLASSGQNTKPKTKVRLNYTKRKTIGPNTSQDETKRPSKGVRKHNRIAKQEVCKNSLLSTEVKKEGALHKNRKNDEKIGTDGSNFCFNFGKVKVWQTTRSMTTLQLWAF